MAPPRQDGDAGSSSSRAWLRRAFVLLFAISILTNGIFVAKFYLPIWMQRWHELIAVKPPVRGSDHIRGPADAAVTIIEYSDFQCPYCAQLHRELNDLSKQTQFRWVYRYYTLNQGHPQAGPSAEAAECAAEQGRFWDYADALFAEQKSLGAPLYATLASRLHLDEKRFDACLAANRYRSVIMRDSLEAKKLYLIGTPTWYVNGTRLMGVVSMDRLHELVAQAAARGR